MQIKQVKAEMKSLGALHAKDGKQLTPHDCQEVDAEILKIAKSMSSHLEDHMERVSSQSKIYKQLRGAFNKGWQEEYYKTVS